MRYLFLVLTSAMLHNLEIEQKGNLSNVNRPVNRYWQFGHIQYVWMQSEAHIKENKIKEK